MPLSEQQRQGAEVFATRGADDRLEDLAAEVGVTRKTLWAWRKDPEFQDAVRERIEYHTWQERGPIFRALCEAAKGGDVAAIRLYLQHRGELVEKQQIDQRVVEVKVSSDIMGADDAGG